MGEDVQGDGPTLGGETVEGVQRDTDEVTNPGYIHDDPIGGPPRQLSSQPRNHDALALE